MANSKVIKGAENTPTKNPINISDKIPAPKPPKKNS